MGGSLGASPFLSGAWASLPAVCFSVPGISSIRLKRCFVRSVGEPLVRRGWGCKELRFP